MGRKMVTRHVYVTQEQDEAIRSISRRTDIPQSVLIRRGIDLMIAMQTARQPVKGNKGAV